VLRIYVLVGLIACHKATPPPAASNTAPREPTPDAEIEITACERHHALETRARECTALSDEIEQQIEQRAIDMLATISESGMDDSTPVDREALCEEEIEYLLRVAGTPCALE
jgi:hypothetical protein